jgi:hypothetical protein
LLKRRKEINNKLSINHKSNLNNGATKERQERGEIKIKKRRNILEESCFQRKQRARITTTVFAYNTYNS